MTFAQQRIAGLSVVLLAVNVALWRGLARDITSMDLGLLALLTLVSCAVEWLPLRFEHRGQILNASLGGVVIVAGVVVASPVTVLIARIVSSLAAIGLRWRLSADKQVINVLGSAIEVWVIAAVMGVAVAGDTGPRLWLTVLGAVMAADVANYAVILTAMGLASGELRFDVVRRIVSGMAYTAAIAAVLGALSVIVLTTEPRGAVVLFGTFVILASLNQARHATSERLSTLQSLYGLLDTLQTTEMDDVVIGALSEAKEATGADVATLYVTAGDAVAVHTTAETDPPRPTGREVTILAGRALGGLLVEEDEPRPDPMLGDGGDQLMVTSFVSETLAGVMVMEGRRGNLPSYNATDVQLGVGFARHTGNAILTAQLVEDLQERTESMRTLALEDPLTGLSNRVGLLDRHPRVTGGVAVIDVIEIDDIDGTFGHQSAERMLIAIADRLTSHQVVEPVAVARVGSNRFAVLLGSRDQVTVHTYAKLLRTAVQAPIAQTAVNLAPHVRIGLAIAPVGGGPTVETLRAATVAAVNTDANDPAGATWYEPAMDAEATRRLLLASDLTDALEEDEVWLAYQPKLDLATGVVLGVEALARWRHPERGMVSPTVFVPLAERTGLIHPMTMQLISRAVSQTALWHRAGRPLGVAINFSPECLRNYRAADHLLEEIEAADLDPSAFTVEITESAMVQTNAVAADVISRLRDAGVRISIDDFGTGYSSLAQLRSLPVDELKIDMAFTAALRTGDEGRAVVRAIVEMAAALRLDVVAEGVEDAETTHILQDLGCSIGQGYHLGRPVSAADLPADPTTASQQDAEQVVRFNRRSGGRA